MTLSCRGGCIRYLRRHDVVALLGDRSNSHKLCRLATSSGNSGDTAFKCSHALLEYILCSFTQHYAYLSDVGCLRRSGSRSASRQGRTSCIGV